MAVTFVSSLGRSAVERERRWCCVSWIGRTAFLLFFLLLLGIRPQQAPAQIQQPDNERSSIRGTVINAVTHAPIGRALVYSTDNRFATFTDNEGHFEFTVPKTATDGRGSVGGSFVVGGQPQRTWSTGTSGIFLMARKPGFLDDPGGNTSVAAGTRSELTISLLPEALIKGRVTLSTNEGARGITVQIFSRQVLNGRPRWVQGQGVRANSNSEFRFAELQPGAYKLLTHEWADNDPAVSVRGEQAYGFPPVYYPSATDFAAAATIQLNAGETYDATLSLIRQPYYDVSIPVANAEPRGGMNITVSPRGHRGPGYALGYNQAKESISGSLPNGSYLVEAQTFGETSSTGEVNLTVAGAPAEGLAMVLSRNRSIALNVKEEFTSSTENSSTSWSDGKNTYVLRGPRAYLQVSAEPAEDFMHQGGGSLRQPASPNDDSLVLEDLPPGRYWLQLGSTRGYVASATMDNLDLLHEPFVVGWGSNAAVEIRMRDDYAEIAGTVATGASTTNGGPSSPGAYIYCVPLPGGAGQFLNISASSDGKFDNPAVVPGTYRVMAFDSRQPNLPYHDADAMRAYETKGQVVHLSPGQKETLQLQIISGSE